MNATLAGSAALLDRIKRLEGAIAENREAKKGIPDCPCWANAPQWVDAELFSVLDESGSGPARVERLEAAIHSHREQKALTPECTCWVTPSAKADVKLYSVLEQP
jgi:hypothetical protein